MNGTRVARRALVAAAVLAVGALRYATRVRLPDDWDAVGFVRAVDHFDLAAFQPHFPGYPVYVALCKLVHAPAFVSALASAATAAALWRLGTALAGARAGWLALALWTGAFVPWVVGGAALSDATATALLAAAFAALTWPGSRAALLGAAAMALALGTRVSYWPLALSFAVVVARWRPAQRRAAVVGATVATAAWLLPFLAVVGVRRLWTLGLVHVAGHFGDWGGSIATRPDVVARVAAFARDLVYDGIWPSPWLCAAALAGCALLWRRPAPRVRAVAAVVVVPYALWALFGQNVIEQPRHLLPLIAAATVAFGCGAARRPLVGVAVVALAFAAATPLMLARLRQPPAAVQLARWVAATHPGRHEAVVFGARSARVMQWAVPSLHVETRTRVSEVLGALERLDTLPRHIYVTSELADDDPARTATAHERLQFCRDPRLDRQSPCLGLRSYNWQP